MARGRVLLREPAASDRDEFLLLVRESKRLHRGWVTPPGDAEAFTRFLRRARSDNVITRLVCERDGGRIAGVVSVSEIVRGNFQSAFLGYYAHAAFAGHGLMTEALRLMLRHVFTRAGLHRLEANVQPANARSIRLVRSLGFRLEGFSPRYLRVAGRWKDHQRWAITREDWLLRAKVEPAQAIE
jgi:ribosomal-protein-alanine N-acetyltransferase